MRSCPTCQRVYTDSTVKFCRFDGAVLRGFMPTSEEFPATLTFHKTLDYDSSSPAPPLSVAAAPPPSLPGATRLQTSTLLPDEEEGFNSIAVLPLVNSDADPELEYLSDGIAESIINSLSQLPRLRVISKGTVFRFKGRTADPQEAGHYFGVRAVLMGKVKQFAERLIVGVELVDVQDGSQLWGETYSREFSDLLQVQEVITREILDALRLKLSIKEKDVVAKRYTDNVEAYQNYLKGRYAWNKRNEASLHRAITYFQQAIALDPAYALAYTGLADSYVSLGVYGVLPPEEAFTRAKAAAVEALELDDSLAEAHTSLAHINESYEWRFKAAERKFKRALELNPSYALAHHWYALHLMAMGRSDEARLEIACAQQLEPLSLSIGVSVGLAYYWERDYPRALEEFKKVLALDPEFSLVHVLLGQTYEKLGAHEQAISELLEARQQDDTPQVSAILSYVYAVSGRETDARQILHELNESSYQDYVPSYFKALIHAALGEADEAFRWLQRSLDERSGWMVWLKVDPRLDALRPDPRFGPLLVSVGLSSGADKEAGVQS